MEKVKEKKMLKKDWWSVNKEEKIPFCHPQRISRQNLRFFFKYKTSTRVLKRGLIFLLI